MELDFGPQDTSFEASFEPFGESICQNKIERPVLRLTSCLASASTAVKA